MLEFHDDFEPKVIGYFFIDGDLPEKDAKHRNKAQIIFGHLPRNLFKHRDLRDLYSVIIDYYTKSSKLPNLSNFKQLVHDKYSEKNKLEQRDKLLGILTECINLIKTEDIDFVEDTLEQRVKKEYLRQEVKESLDFIKSKDGHLSDEEYRKIENKVISATAWKSQTTTNLEFFDEERLDEFLGEDYRHPIPTGIDYIDELTKGGMALGEFALILAEKGLGKTTILSYIANTAYTCGYNVLHIVFEDKKFDIKRKHAAKISGIGLDFLTEYQDLVKERVIERCRPLTNRLFVERMSNGSTTVSQIRNLIRQLQVQNDLKIHMVVVDYIDCLVTSSGSSDKNHAQEEIARALESLSFEENIVVWSAVQANRKAYGNSDVSSAEMGGSISRAVIAHFVAAFGKEKDSIDPALATCYIDKNRIGKDRITFKETCLDNVNMRISKNKGFFADDGIGYGTQTPRQTQVKLPYRQKEIITLNEDEVDNYMSQTGDTITNRIMEIPEIETVETVEITEPAQITLNIDEKIKEFDF